MTLLRILARFPVIHRLAHRGDKACPLCAYVWRVCLSDPAFRASLIEGQRDIAEGRVVPHG